MSGRVNCDVRVGDMVIGGQKVQGSVVSYVMEVSVILRVVFWSILIVVCGGIWGEYQKKSLGDIVLV